MTEIDWLSGIDYPEDVHAECRTTLEAAERRIERLEAAQEEERLYRVLWKQTEDANLNTDEGCRQAARVLAEYFAALRRNIEEAWDETGGPS